MEAHDVGPRPQGGGLAVTGPQRRGQVVGDDRVLVPSRQPLLDRGTVPVLDRDEAQLGGQHAERRAQPVDAGRPLGRAQPRRPALPAEGVEGGRAGAVGRAHEGGVGDPGHPGRAAHGQKGAEQGGRGQGRGRGQGQPASPAQGRQPAAPDPGSRGHGRRPRRRRRSRRSRRSRCCRRPRGSRPRGSGLPRPPSRGRQRRPRPPRHRSPAARPAPAVPVAQGRGVAAVGVPGGGLDRWTAHRQPPPSVPGSANGA